MHGGGEGERDNQGKRRGRDGVQRDPREEGILCKVSSGILKKKNPETRVEEA